MPPKTLRDIPLRPVPVVAPEAALDEVIELMREDPLHTVVLVGDEQYMGMFNEDALLSNLIPASANLANLTVGPYIHPTRAVASLETTVADALTLMRRKNVAVLPVVENVTFRGVVTVADLA